MYFRVMSAVRVKARKKYLIIESFGKPVASCVCVGQTLGSSNLFLSGNLVPVELELLGISKNEFTDLKL